MEITLTRVGWHFCDTLEIVRSHVWCDVDHGVHKSVLRYFDDMVTNDVDYFQLNISDKIVEIIKGSE